MPLLSIVVPVYNKEDTLERALISITQQRCRDFEIIIVNDGSTDNTYSICQKWARQDERIRIVDQENRGVAAARNKGLQAATGQYLAFVDPDDYVEENWLSDLFSDRLSDLVVWGYDRQKYDKNGALLSHKYEIPIDEPFGTVSPNELFQMETQIVYPLWNKLFNRSIIEENNITFPNIQCWEDACFVLEYICHIDTARLLGKCYYNYTETVGSESLSKKSYVPERDKQYHTLYLYSQKCCKALSGGLDAQNKNMMKLLSNAAGDILYNINSKDCPLTKSEKTDYISRVLQNEDLRYALQNINPGQMMGVDISLCVRLMPYGAQTVYMLGKLMFALRRIKNMFRRR